MNRIILLILSAILLTLMACTSKNQAKGADSIEDLIGMLVASTSRGDWQAYLDLATNPQNATSLDHAIFLAPENGNLKSAKYLTIDESIVEWSDMAEFIESKAKEGDYVLRLDWEYEAEHGPAKLEQYYVVVSVDGRYFFRM